MESRDSESEYKFESLDGTFTAILSVDRDGLVKDYPELFKRVWQAEDFALAGTQTAIEGTINYQNFENRRRGETRKMLKLKPNCECCDKDLPPSSLDAMVCTFECTFCRDCVETKLNSVCPNYGGDFVPRPVRPANWLEKYPPSRERVYKPERCAATL